MREEGGRIGVVGDILREILQGRGQSVDGKRMREMHQWSAEV